MPLGDVRTYHFTTPLVFMIIINSSNRGNTIGDDDHDDVCIGIKLYSPTFFISVLLNNERGSNFYVWLSFSSEATKQQHKHKPGSIFPKGQASSLHHHHTTISKHQQLKYPCIQTHNTTIYIDFVHQRCIIFFLCVWMYDFGYMCT